MFDDKRTGLGGVRHFDELADNLFSDINGVSLPELVVKGVAHHRMDGECNILVQFLQDLLEARQFLGGTME